MDKHAQRGSQLDTAANKLVDLLGSLPTDDKISAEAKSAEVLSAISTLVPALTPNRPLFASFHDGQVHDPLGGGSYAFQFDIIGPMLLALYEDERQSSTEDPSDRLPYEEPNNGESILPDDIAFERNDSGSQSCLNALFQPPSSRLPTRPIVIHAGAQPNNSPHAGTLVVFCCAFALARAMRDRMQAVLRGTEQQPPPVSVEIMFVDTAPAQGHEVKVDGIHYQKSYRDVPGALERHLADYLEVFQHLSSWSGVPFTTAFQSDFFTASAMPSLVRYVVACRARLGPQLSPKYGTLALRASCPSCGLAEKHGCLNEYSDASITFHCPRHGAHSMRLSRPEEVARLEANAPTRNLLRSMSHLLDDTRHDVRVTGADYAGTYQEMLLYRPLAAWSAATGLAAGRTPHLLYAPLVVDWSGAKLSKALYVREGGYDAMAQLGTDSLCSYARLRAKFGGDGSKGLKAFWDEVQRWVADPRKLFRTYSVEYLQRVMMEQE